jgi:PAS domain S-box-containing protein
MPNSQTPTSVLIVEDEGIIARNLRELLLGLDYDPFAIAATSDEAVARASERCPDVVLMDIRIKGKLDGIETAEILHKRFDVPVIYLTAHADESTLERAKKTEPFGYLMKPVKLAELRSAIEVARYKHSMEKSLRARERWLSTTMRSIADAVIMVDIAGKITFLNQAAESLLGVTLQTAAGRSTQEIMRMSDVEWQTETPLDRALREQRPVAFAEAVLHDANGSKRLIADSAAPVIDEEELLGAVMVFRDVTEQKRLQKQLEIADRLASLGTMAAGVAHEINNPLTVVVGNAEFVLEHLRRSATPSGPGTPVMEAEKVAIESAIEAQRELMTAASRIARIVSDLLDFSRPERASSGSVDIRNAIEWAIRSTAHEFRNRARISTKLQKVPLVDGDETRLGQVFVNLLINAAHAIAPGNADGNEVSVTTRTDETGHVVAEVSDTGGGIPPESLSRIFEPFFTTKRVGEGTGLGLSICQGLVASMGGELAVDSRPGEGTTFVVRLPAGGRQAPALSEHSPVTGHRRGRLLLIDDDEMVLRALSRILDHHELVTTVDAREALEWLKTDDGFDIILCDLMMPAMTGMDFYEELLCSQPDLARRVVFLTGGAVTPKIARFLESVPNQSILKPFGVEDLRTMIQTILSKDKSRN